MAENLDYLIPFGYVAGGYHGHCKICNYEDWEMGMRACHCQVCAQDLYNKSKLVATSKIKWDIRFFGLAKFYSTWSKDPSTKCGAVITRGKRQISEGFNGFPSGTSDTEDILENRERKYLRVLHAELNAILYSKQDITGCTIYVYPFIPCSQCMSAIIQSGITRIVTQKPIGELLDRWKKSNDEALLMAEEVGIIIDYVEEGLL